MKKFTILLLSILLSAPLFAQIDPTVVVDRDFEGQIDMDVRMPDRSGHNRSGCPPERNHGSRFSPRLSGLRGTR